MDCCLCDDSSIRHLSNGNTQYKRATNKFESKTTAIRDTHTGKTDEDPLAGWKQSRDKRFILHVSFLHVLFVILFNFFVFISHITSTCRGLSNSRLYVCCVSVMCVWQALLIGWHAISCEINYHHTTRNDSTHTHLSARLPSDSSHSLIHIYPYKFCWGLTDSSSKYKCF